AHDASTDSPLDPARGIDREGGCRTGPLPPVAGPGASPHRMVGSLVSQMVCNAQSRGCTETWLVVRAYVEFQAPYRQSHLTDHQVLCRSQESVHFGFGRRARSAGEPFGGQALHRRGWGLRRGDERNLLPGNGSGGAAVFGRSLLPRDSIGEVPEHVLHAVDRGEDG